MLSRPGTMQLKEKHTATETALATTENLFRTFPTGPASSSRSLPVAVNTWFGLRTRAHD